MTEHTPGPWEAHGDYFLSIDAGWDEEYHVYTRRVAEIPSWRGDDQVQADRRLVAAAPDLLEACEKAEQLALVALDWNLVEAEIDGEMVSVYDLVDVFRTAVAKAREGEE